MIFHPIILFISALLMLAGNTVQAASTDVYGTGTRYYHRPAMSAGKKTEEKKPIRTGANIALENAVKSPAGSNVGLTTGFHGNIGLGATPQALSSKPSDSNRPGHGDEWRRSNYGRQPVRFDDGNRIDDENNVHHRSQDPYPSAEDNAQP